MFSQGTGVFMFKVILVAISLATGQPIGIGVSTEAYSAAECNAQIVNKAGELAKMLNGRIPGGVKVEGKCATQEDADKLFETAGPSA